MTVSVGGYLLVVKTTYVSNRWQLLLRLCHVQPRLGGDRAIVRGIRPRGSLVVVVHSGKDDWDIRWECR